MTFNNKIIKQYGKMFDRQVSFYKTFPWITGLWMRILKIPPAADFKTARDNFKLVLFNIFNQKQRQPENPHK